MIKYDKLLKKLGKFDELPKKKQEKLLEQVLCSKEMKEWFYSTDNSDQPITKGMSNEIMNKLAVPRVMKKVTKFIERKKPEEFDRTSCAIAFMIVIRGYAITNETGSDLTAGFKEGAVSSKQMKGFKEKAATYKDYLDDLFRAIKEKAKEDIKYASKKANVPKGLVYAAYFFVPNNKYIPKFKINGYVNICLKQIYEWVGKHGLEDIQNVNWHQYFIKVLNADIVASGAISVLLEGVRRIDDYRNLEHFEDVCKVWDALTLYAMSELDNAPDHVRRQMIELYVKRLERLFHNGKGPRLRVNLIDTPTEFVNLRKTMDNYSDRIVKIMGVKNRSEEIEDRHKERIKEAIEEVKMEEVEDTGLPDYTFDKEEDDEDDDEN